MSSLISKYKKYRKAGIELNSKMMDTLDASFIEAFKILGIVEIIDGKNTVVIDEGEDPLLSDFSLFDFKYDDGKNTITRYKESIGGKNEVENEILEAMMYARSSLFEIIKTDPKNNTVVLRDVLDEPEEITIIDVGFSQSAPVGGLLFARIIPFDEFNMTSGASFAFLGGMKSYLLRAYKRQMKKAMKKRHDEVLNRFVVFFHLNREVGAEVMYQ